MTRVVVIVVMVVIVVRVATRPCERSHPSLLAGSAYLAAPINSIVYPVHGGMEDWAYAAS